MASVTRRSRRRGMSTLMKFVVGFIVVFILFLVGMVPKVLNDRRIDAEAHDLATAPPPVEAVSPREAKPDSLLLPGNVDAILKTSTQSRTTGYVSKLYVDIGARVKAGQLLAEVQSPDVDEQFIQADAQTAQSRATVSESLADVQRLKAGILQSRAAVWQQRANVVQTTAAVEGSKSAKAQAEANLKVSQATLAQKEKVVLAQKAALNQADANYNLGLANYKREHALLEEAFVAQQDFDQAETTLKTDIAAVASAKANVDAAVADETASQQTVQANRQAVRSAQASEDQAAANLKGAKASLESSIQSLSASESSEVAGEETVKANVGALGASEANARRYNVMRSFEQIVAPFDGIITARNVEVGSLVSPGQTASTDASSTTPSTGLFGIAKIDTVRIFVSLPQTNYQWAPPGTTVNVHVREVPNQVFKGVVKQTSGALDMTTRTLLTEIRLPNPKGILLPGMFAQVEFSAGSATELRIPSSTILVDAQGTKVIVIDATNHIHFQTVVLGRDYGEEAEVTRGVKSGDRLVANASDSMVDGEAVQVLKKETKK